MITLDQAHEMGAKGAEPTEAESLLFEAWMRGHCWMVHGDWDGKTYVHETERNGEVNYHTMHTRQLWAAWRDRAALVEQPAQQEQGDSICQEDDGCPTEKVVLQRFWRGEPIPAEHYPAWFKPAPVQQEPFATVYSFDDLGGVYELVSPPKYRPPVGTKLYTSPPAQRKPCQVWDAKGYDALCQELEGWKARAQRKPLTPREYNIALALVDIKPSLYEAVTRAIEAAHNIKEQP